MAERRLRQGLLVPAGLHAVSAIVARHARLGRPKPERRWLDLGCGGGALTRAIWERTNGLVGSVVGLDCAAANEVAYRQLRETLSPPPADRIQFIHHDFSSALGLFPDAAFDNAVSGLSISYAECYDEAAKRWTSAAYDRLLAELLRVIRPGGRLVFSVNVPEPSWATVAFRSLPGLFRLGHPLRFLKRSWRMLRYGRWLRAKRGRGDSTIFPPPRWNAA